MKRFIGGKVVEIEEVQDGKNYDSEYSSELQAAESSSVSDEEGWKPNRAGDENSS